MADAFKDFIPEGEAKGAQGNGFQDFVPAPEVQEVVEAPAEEAPVEEPIEAPVEEPVKVSRKKGAK